MIKSSHSNGIDPTDPNAGPRATGDDVGPLLSRGLAWPNSPRSRFMGMTDYQYITYKNVDGVAVVNFLETVSMFEGDKVKGVSEELIDLIDSKRFSKLLLNLSNAHFVSSAMLAHLVKLNRKMHETKGKVRLCCLRPVIQDAFRVSNFDKIFEIFPDEAAALRKF
jgi:anti-anti-sigma factor